MPATKVKTKWSSGSLIFTDNDGTERIAVDEDGLDIKAGGVLKKGGVALIGGATIGITDNEDGTFSIAVQLNDSGGNALATHGAVFAYLSKDANGDTVCADGTDTSEFIIGTDGLYLETIADIAGWFISEADGDIDMTVTVITTKKAYLVIVLPDGRLVVGAEMAYTAP